MMKQLIPFTLLFLLFLQPAFSQEKIRPKIGLTLSGGGAKGIAHIGILKALDSAGIRVDFITGTSMGSIVGALYAIGYTGKEIERMANEIDWNTVLTNSSGLDGIIMEEKEEYTKYAVELPYSNNRFRMFSGVLEAEELWLKFSELFFPVRHIKNFNEFRIPFKCIATNAADGSMVILDKGEIVNAVRSSMAIPSFFTAVDFDSLKLVDGGVVRNFPVTDVREMGANYVIGVNVSSGLAPAEKLNNPLTMLLNIVFFKEAEDSRKEIPLCDIYIPMPVQNYTAASFGRSRDIMDTGIIVGERMYPVFKKLKDSLDAIYGAQDYAPESISVPEAVYITEVEVNGLKHTEKSFFLHTMDFETHRNYTAKQLSKMIRKAFGLRYYSRITYALDCRDDGTSRIIFSVDENALAAAKLSIHYNKFTGISLVTNFTIRNLLTNSSRSMLTLNLGEKFRAKAEHMEYVGRTRSFSVSLGAQYEFLDFNSYDDYEETAIYRQQYVKADLRVGYAAHRRFSMSLGTRFETLKYRPSLKAAFNAGGKNNFFTSYLQFRYNSLDRNVYPKKGVRAETSAEWVYGQQGNITYYENGREIFNTDSLGLSYDPYARTTAQIETYTPTGRNGTFMTLSQAGINFNYNQYFLNDFYVGGLTRLFRNQIVFAGYQEGMRTTGSLLAFQAGYRQQLYNNLYVQWKSNIMYFDFIKKNDNYKPSFLSGHMLGVSYLTAIGPVEFSVMYGDQSRKLGTYVNIGLGF